MNYLCTRNRTREFSSAGSEHLPYKQRVGGSNPSTPTKQKSNLFGLLFCFVGASSQLYLHSHPIPLPLAKEGVFDFFSVFSGCFFCLWELPPNYIYIPTPLKLSNKALLASGLSSKCSFTLSKLRFLALRPASK